MLGFILQYLEMLDEGDGRLAVLENRRTWRTLPLVGRMGTIPTCEHATEGFLNVAVDDFLIAENFVRLRKDVFDHESKLLHTNHYEATLLFRHGPYCEPKHRG